MRLKSTLIYRTPLGHLDFYFARNFRQALNIAIDQRTYADQKRALDVLGESEQSWEGVRTISFCSSD